MWKATISRLPRKCVQVLSTSSLNLSLAQIRCHSRSQKPTHRHQRTSHQRLNFGKPESAPREIRITNASTWYLQQAEPTDNKTLTMGKKKMKKDKKAAAAALRNSASNAGSATPATPASVDVDISHNPQDQPPQAFAGNHSSQPAWPAAKNMPKDSSNRFGSNDLPSQAQGPQTSPGFQQPFNMVIPQPNLFSGFQQHLPVQQQVPSMHPGFTLPQPGSDQAQQPNFNHFFSPPIPPAFFMPMPNANHQQQVNTTTMPIHQPSHVRNENERPQSTNGGGGGKANRPSIQPPSRESGGIPDPTPAYLVRASFLPQRRAHPGPLLVVIDLNGTVLHRPSSKQSSRFLARRHAPEFVRYCVRTFWVVIWSSARPENVFRMVDQLLPPDDLRQVVAVWGREKFNLTVADYNARTQCYKRLTTLWGDPVVRATYPYQEGCWNQGNTVLIDDSAEKARSEPHNAITLPEFTGDVNEGMDVLPGVHDYLNELCYQEDVSAYMRANPFKMA